MTLFKTGLFMTNITHLFVLVSLLISLPRRESLQKTKLNMNGTIIRLIY